MAEEMLADEVTPEPRKVLIISAGASHSVALLSGDIVCSWGRGEDGQLGHGDAEDRPSPTQLSALDDHHIVSVTCGADHTVAYSQSRMEVYSWGWGDFGRLGHGNSSDLFTPLPIKALQGIRIKQIACGDSHCLAVTMEGEVQSWGRNQNGQLGLGDTEDSLVPQKIQAFEGIRIKMVAAGAEHTAAVTEDGDLYGWGWGRYGNLGLGDRNDRLVPERVTSAGGEKMSMVACGWRHTISVSYSGALYTYGWSKYGQLGHGDLEDHLIPHKLEALGNSFISQISGGWRHTMALTADGKLYGWGWNKFGQVGVGNNLDQCSPVQVRFPDDEVQPNKILYKRRQHRCNPNFTRKRLSSGVSNFLDSYVVEAMFNDLSHATQKFGRKDISLYWYVEDSSILEKHDPILIYRNIKSGLSEKGYTGDMSIIFAYVDYKSRLSKELSRDYMLNRICICPLPKGNRYAMLTQILVWAMIKHGSVSNLILLSTNFQKEKQVVSVLQALKERDNFNIVLQDPATLLEASVGDPLDQSRYAHKDHPFDQSNKKFCCKCKKPLIKEGESSSQNQ